MSITQVITTLNQMEADGIVERYAIGGAVGATFYLEPVATIDVDAFVALPGQPGSHLISLRPVLEYLVQRGATLQGEYAVVAGWPVQFLPPGTPLIEAALTHARVIDVEGTPARVMTAEYLAAIALDTGRAKDKARLLQFVEAGVLALDEFQTIVSRYGLAKRWQEFQRTFKRETD